MDGQAFGEGRFGLVNELVVEADVELVILRAHTVGSCTTAHLPCGLEDRREIEMRRLRRAKLLINLEHISATNHLVDGTEAELGHVSTKVFSKIVEEINDLLRLPCKFRSQLWILGSNANRTCVHYNTEDE